MPNFNNPFPSWGDVGQSPPDGFQYSGGDQVREDHLDFIWYQQNIVTSDIIDEFDRLDSNNDGQVDAADVADTGSDPFSLVGDLNAADGETIWDETATHIPQGRLENDSVTIANNVVSLGGSTPINYTDISNRSHGNEDHDVSYTTLTEVNNNADVPNADFADSAGDADTVDGQHASNFTVVDYQEFTSTGSYMWNKPSNANLVHIQLVGAGEDATDAEGSTSGGNGGSIVEHRLDASRVGSSVSVTVGAGGIPGGHSTFGDFIAPGGGSSKQDSTILGSNSGGGGSNGAGHMMSAGGGGGGGGSTNDGYPGGLPLTNISGGGGSGGAEDINNGGESGGNGTTINGFGSGGGGGGSGSNTVPGGDGGDGGWPGGGGGGSGFSNSGTISNGGLGADGVVRVWTLA